MLAIPIRNQTKGSASMLMSCPKMAVKPNMSTTKCSLRKLLFRRNDVEVNSYYGKENIWNPNR